MAAMVSEHSFFIIIIPPSKDLSEDSFTNRRPEAKGFASHRDTIDGK
jgi:hypothetical protein